MPHRIREALDAVSRRRGPRACAYDGTLRGPVLLRRAAARCGVRRRGRRTAAHRPQPQRHRHDDVPDAPAGVRAGPGVEGGARAAREPPRSRLAAPRDGHGGAHAHAAGPANDLAHYLLAVIEQLERDAARLRAAFQTTNRNPLGACAITGTGFAIDRMLTSDLLGFDGPTGNTYGSIATVDYLLESISATAMLLAGLGPLRAGSAAVGNGEFELRPLRRRLRAVQQHHAAEAQPCGHRARARHRQQGARPGTGHRHGRAQHAVWRHRGYRRRPAAAGVVDVPRRDARGRLVAAAMPTPSSTPSGSKARRRRWTTLTELADTLARDHDLPFMTAACHRGQGAEGARRETPSRICQLCWPARQCIRGPATALQRRELQRILSPRYFVNVRTTLGGPAPAETAAPWHSRQHG